MTRIYTGVMDSQTIHCPYCGERLEVVVDWSVRNQEYIEDCQICCQPMVLHVLIDDDRQVVINAKTDAE